MNVLYQDILFANKYNSLLQISIIYIHHHHHYRIMSGFSQGGSMAFRFNCEKSESIGGLVIGGQAWFDPALGYYDYTNNNVLKGKAICNPTFKRPFLNVIGNVDNYYGEDTSSVISGFVGIENWRNYSTEVLMCKGDVKTKLDFNITFSTGNKATCYNYSSCPLITSTGMNVYCSVNNMGHDGYALQTAIIKAMYQFFVFVITKKGCCQPSSLTSQFSMLCGVIICIFEQNLNFLLLFLDIFFVNLFYFAVCCINMVLCSILYNTLYQTLFGYFMIDGKYFGKFGKFGFGIWIIFGLNI